MEPLRRNVRMTVERPRQWPLVVGFVSMVVLCVSVLALRRTTAPQPPQPQAQPQPEPELEPVIVRARAGTCSAGLLPASMIQKVTDEEAQELVALVDAWLGERDSFGSRPAIVHRRGVLWVESEEDRGDDPPYPRSAAPEAERVCGSAAAWLRTHLRERMTYTGGDVALQCSGNVCCYSGMEYSPSGMVVFRHSGTGWSLDAWVQYQVAALGEDYVTANLRHVETSLARLARTTCPGEPPARAD
jgi:hypothetical protein